MTKNLSPLITIVTRKEYNNFLNSLNIDEAAREVCVYNMITLSHASTVLNLSEFKMYS